MRCPFCKADDDRVIDSRSAAGGGVIRRRRVCNRCERRYTTYERVEEMPLKVIKRDGRREPFDLEKIQRVVRLAAGKRPVSDEDLEHAVYAMEETITHRYEREVPSKDIAEVVMAGLQKLDPVAYLRYAAEYKDLRDIVELVGPLEGLFEDT